mmetsp:Transcript_17008/g.68591  ORF Transcript_17008/g.68591 Transcript_17008/m.68591 type:complete len:691 (+) Transcript_17008:364-2436(+)
MSAVLLHARRLFRGVFLVELDVALSFVLLRRGGGGHARRFVRVAIERRDEVEGGFRAAPVIDDALVIQAARAADRGVDVGTHGRVGVGHVVARAGVLRAVVALEVEEVPDGQAREARLVEHGLDVGAEDLVLVVERPVRIGRVVPLVDAARARLGHDERLVGDGVGDPVVDGGPVGARRGEVARIRVPRGVRVERDERGVGQALVVRLFVGGPRDEARRVKCLQAVGHGGVRSAGRRVFGGALVEEAPRHDGRVVERGGDHLVELLELQLHERLVGEVLDRDARAEGLFPHGDAELVEPVEPALVLRVVRAADVRRPRAREQADVAVEVGVRGRHGRGVGPLRVVVVARQRGERGAVQSEARRVVDGDGRPRAEAEALADAAAATVYGGGDAHSVERGVAQRPGARGRRDDVVGEDGARDAVFEVQSDDASRRVVVVPVEGHRHVEGAREVARRQSDGHVERPRVFVLVLPRKQEGRHVGPPDDGGLLLIRVGKLVQDDRPDETAEVPEVAARVERRRRVVEPVVGEDDQIDARIFLGGRRGDVDDEGRVPAGEIRAHQRAVEPDLAVERAAHELQTIRARRTELDGAPIHKGPARARNARRRRVGRRRHLGRLISKETGRRVDRRVNHVVEAVLGKPKVPRAVEQRRAVRTDELRPPRGRSGREVRRRRRGRDARRPPDAPHDLPHRVF